MHEDPRQELSAVQTMSTSQTHTQVKEIFSDLPTTEEFDEELLLYTVLMKMSHHSSYYKTMWNHLLGYTTLGRLQRLRTMRETDEQFRAQILIHRLMR